MEARVIATGVTLSTPRESAVSGDEIDIWAQVWVDLDEGGEVGRSWGQVGIHGELTLGEEPTNALIAAAQEQRELGLGGVLGDLRSGGYDVAPFECYAAPFRVELTDRLRLLLSGTWRYRDPRLESGPDLPLPPW